MTILFLLLCLVLTGAVSAAGSDELARNVTIKYLDAQYTVSEDGSCDVVLSAALSFTGRVTEFTLPLPAGSEILTVSINSYSTRREDDTLLLTLESSSGALQDQTLTVGYRLRETVTADGEEQHFTLPLLAPNRECAIEHYSATITLPKPFEELPVFESSYYGELIDNYLTLSIQEGTIALQTTQALRDHESLSVSLTVPTSYFDLRFLSGKTVRFGEVAFWLLLVEAVACWLFFLRNRFFVPKAQAMPPLDCNAGAVPYLLTGDTPDLALMILYWATLGYLSIARTRKGKLYLKKQIDMGNERKPYEIQIFRQLFAHTDLCSAHTDEFRSLRERTPELTRKYWKRRLFGARFTDPRILRLFGVGCGIALGLTSFDILVPAQSWRWFVIVPLTLLYGLGCWLLQPVPTCPLRRRPMRTLLRALPALLFLLISGAKAGVGLLAFLCILAQLLIGLGIALGGRRTKTGLRLASELLGYRRYLLRTPSAELREPLKDDPHFFYRTLPFADALSIGDRFTACFSGMRMEPCSWLTSETSRPRTAAEFRRFYRLVLDELREQTDTPLKNVISNMKKRR